MTEQGRPGPGKRLLAAVSLAVVLAAALAVVVQDHTGELPLGLWNEGAELYRAASHVALAGLLILGGVFAIECVASRRLPAAGTARGLLVALALTELLVTALDVGVVSRASGPALGGPYREVVSRAGTRTFLKRPHPGSPLGFRSEAPATRDPERPRILFLGDSYTEGSGRSAACNYPDVVGAELRRRGLDWTVWNAGVAGYGPVDAAALHRYLREEGYRFDAVVLSLFLENDFTDNLPGTERRVVAGINFRFPERAWLRWLHPLNSRTFRYLVFGYQVSQLRGSRDDFVTRGDGQCRPPPPLADPLPEGLRTLVERRLARNYGPAAPPLATGPVARSLDVLSAETAELGVPLAVVVFPDRVRADPDLRERLGIDPADYDLERLRSWVRAHTGGVPVIDVTPALGGAQHYRPGDTHLSDPGNVVAGRFVADSLAGLFADRGW